MRVSYKAKINSKSLECFTTKVVCDFCKKTFANKGAVNMHKKMCRRSPDAYTYLQDKLGFSRKNYKETIKK